MVFRDVETARPTNIGPVSTSRSSAPAPWYPAPWHRNCLLIADSDGHRGSKCQMRVHRAYPRDFSPPQPAHRQPLSPGRPSIVLPRECRFAASYPLSPACRPSRRCRIAPDGSLLRRHCHNEVKYPRWRQSARTPETDLDASWI